ncbi:uncharacterized protein LOC123543595 [Mercenaria mercenaria]|uniref:uncharacterized protein LOC123543595 n=1 Tax=Mercenaria mercenaria TaxID=6596 RepID=UPI00234F1ED3|nr:uncharacterized protein LOC123543595 [Mercenaria mercenaria]XP_053390967.1 uncharacterized protein LOC123543595 [Mercenaria mercenaria]XP_053390968.1 uncharacterized protein LOC123543595 [Mercenaria mercenaria]XP_053390969.1 uncharacterized protein LOC123543595 [Mercenaria mercenaria]XP_053390970.1 uncharacterized protein LOC123543595 [Mercenaria mercenaria]
MAERRLNSPTDKHFQNGQRRHKEREAETNLRRGCRRPEESNISFSQSRTRSFTESVRFDVNTETVSYGASRNNDGVPQYLPNPSVIDREFLNSLRRYPEHLWPMLLFNRIPVQRSSVVEGNNSEIYQYEKARKKEKARRVLLGISKTLRAEGVILQENMIEMILERLEAVYL